MLREENPRVHKRRIARMISKARNGVFSRKEIPRMVTNQRRRENEASLDVPIQHIKKEKMLCRGDKQTRRLWSDGSRNSGEIPGIRRSSMNWRRRTLWFTTPYKGCGADRKLLKR